MKEEVFKLMPIHSHFAVEEVEKHISLMFEPFNQHLVVLATGPNSRVGSGFGSTRNRTVATGLTTRKTRTVGNGAVLPPTTRHLKSTIFAPLKYLSSDHIMT